MRAETGTSLRRSCGTAIAFLTWTMPSMSSQSSPRTGKREWPVRRDSRSTSSARLVAVDAGAAHARRHDVVGRALAEPERAGQQPRGRRGRGCRPRPSAGRGAASSCGVRAARQLLLRLDAERAQEGVGRAVEHDDERLGDDGEDAHGQRHDLRRRERRGDAEDLRHQLAEDHREDGREQQAERARHAPRPPRRESPSAVSGPREEAPIDGLREEADDEGRERDADLGAGQLGRELRSDWSTTRARESPSSMARWTVGRSRATRENSAATKSAVPAVSSTAPRTRSHSVTGAHPRRAAGRAGRRRQVMVRPL